MAELILCIFICGILNFFFFKLGKAKGDAELYQKILKNNPDYFLTEDLKIEKVWCVPE